MRSRLLRSSARREPIVVARAIRLDDLASGLDDEILAPEAINAPHVERERAGVPPHDVVVVERVETRPHVVASWRVAIGPLEHAVLAERGTTRCGLGLAPCFRPRVHGRVNRTDPPIARAGPGG